MNPSHDVPQNNSEALTQAVLSLTDRELDVLLEVANDLTNTEIGRRLHITPKSVENYRTRIAARLGCSGYGLLARFTRRHRSEICRVYVLITGKLPPHTDS